MNLVKEASDRILLSAKKRFVSEQKDKKVELVESLESGAKSEFDRDLDSLSELTSESDRQAKKEELLEKWRSIAEADLKNEKKDSEVLPRWIVWHADLDRAERFFTLIEKAIGFGLRRPLGFVRNLTTLRWSLALERIDKAHQKGNNSWDEVFKEVFSKIISFEDIKPTRINMLLRYRYFVAKNQENYAHMKAIYQVVEAYNGKAETKLKPGIKKLFEAIEKQEMNTEETTEYECFESKLLAQLASQASS